MSCPRQRLPSLVAGPCAAPARRRTALAALVAAAASLWLAGVTAFADAQEISLESILALLAQRRHGHALYTEEVQSALLKHPLHSSGELFFDAPDRLEKKALQPVAQDLIVEGDVLTVVRGKHRASMQLGDYPQLRPLLTGLRATLAGDRSTLEKNFQLDMAASGSAWTLTLQPLASETAPVYRRIEIRGIDGNVQGVTLERVNGQRTIMSLTEPAGS
jgi:outer membrane lipoprotein carrier protein LolA